LKDYDAIVVGCGFSGATAARVLAEKGMTVLILEKREHIAGNMFDCLDSNGVLIHRYGPHIFHTNNKSVCDFLSRFTEFIPYKHCVVGKIKGKIVPIPFNFESMDILFGKDKSEKFKAELKEKFKDKTRVTITELLACDGDIKKVGEYVFENVFLHYTAKQWGMPIEKVDKSVISRVPVVLSYDRGYFSDTYQFMPKDGYTNLFKNMLDHPNITVKTGVDALSLLKPSAKNGTITFEGKPYLKPVIFTAPADELFSFVYGRLPYRSLDLKFTSLPQNQFQNHAVVNYPNEEDFTRITEFKNLTGQKVTDKTTILKEYPLSYSPESEKSNPPYYPISNSENLALYKKYSDDAEKIKNLFLCGRLAQYKYFNMDGAVASALSLAEKIASK
jgi:UDP-galactopyranose mutase